MVKWHCFYTFNTPYEREAERCRTAFAQYGLEIRLLPYKSYGNWMKNCLQRATLLDGLSLLQDDDAPLGLIDSDIRPVKRPDLMFDFGGDFAAHYRGAEVDPCRRYCAGVLIFGGTPCGRSLLREWAELCRADPQPDAKVREQVYLTQVADTRRVNHEFQFVNLGDTYNRHWERVGEHKDTVLVHWECSRFHARRVGGLAW